jgi:hypothetical protein
MERAFRIATLGFGWVVGMVVIAWAIVSMRHDAAKEERERIRDEAQAGREDRREAREKDREKDLAALKPKPGEVLTLSSANAYHATVTMTNASSDDVRRACFIATVTHKQTGLTAKSVEVCSGAIAPRSTLTVDAPFQVGAIEKLCTDPVKGFTWDVCSLEIAAPPN